MYPDLPGPDSGRILRVWTTVTPLNAARVFLKRFLNVVRLPTWVRTCQRRRCLCWEWWKPINCLNYYWLILQPHGRYSTVYCSVRFVVHSPLPTVFFSHKTWVPQLLTTTNVSGVFVLCWEVLRWSKREEFCQVRDLDNLGTELTVRRPNPPIVAASWLTGLLKN